MLILLLSAFSPFGSFVGLLVLLLALPFYLFYFPGKSDFDAYDLVWRSICNGSPPLFPGFEPGYPHFVYYVSKYIPLSCEIQFSQSYPVPFIAGFYFSIILVLTSCLIIHRFKFTPRFICFSISCFLLSFPSILILKPRNSISFGFLFLFISLVFYFRSFYKELSQRKLILFKCCLIFFSFLPVLFHVESFPLVFTLYPLIVFPQLSPAYYLFKLSTALKLKFSLSKLSTRPFKIILFIVLFLSLSFVVIPFDFAAWIIQQTLSYLSISDYQNYRVFTSLLGIFLAFYLYRLTVRNYSHARYSLDQMSYIDMCAHLVFYWFIMVFLFVLLIPNLHISSRLMRPAETIMIAFVMSRIFHYFRPDI